MECVYLIFYGVVIMCKKLEKLCFLIRAFFDERCRKIWGTWGNFGKGLVGFSASLGQNYIGCVIFNIVTQPLCVNSEHENCKARTMLM